MALTEAQRSVAGRALARARRRAGATARPTKALLLALGVESNYADLPYGDRDSEGGLQQRPSQGWGPASESLETDVDQFLDRAIALNRRGFRGSAGQLAQAVQRSAFPDRYDQVAPTVAKLLGSSGGQAQGNPQGGGAPGVGAIPTGDPAQAAAIASFLAAQSAPKPQQQSMGLAAPAHSAGVAMPAGARLATSTGAPVPASSSVDRQLAAIAALPGPSAPVEGSDGGSSLSAAPGAGGAVPGGSRGRVKVRAGANADGRPMSKGLMKVLGAISAHAGEEITVGTGTNHRQYTVSGNISDHSTGNGADVPAAGERLVKLGQAALIAAGMPEAQARKRGGVAAPTPHSATTNGEVGRSRVP